jgi:enoyl-CoA hydratase
MTDTSFELIETRTEGRVGVITLRRDKALNALNGQLVEELGRAAKAFDADPEVGCIVVTGSEKAFAAGADIKEMKDKDAAQVFAEDFITDDWEVLAKVRTPTIAAVSGFALGGGCELAMMCDIIIAGDSAKFGQPEIKLGTIPGAGGTQRLTRAVGKAKAMELCLTGRMMDAEEAERSGLAAKVVPASSLQEEAMKTAQAIAGMSLPIAMRAKEAVNVAFETTLNEGVRFERRSFHASFATQDRKEGMDAFAEKRDPVWKHR